MLFRSSLFVPSALGALLMACGTAPRNDDGAARVDRPDESLDSPAPPQQRGAERTKSTDAKLTVGQGIQIMGATYGFNCGAPGGNETGALSSACDGLGACDYRVDYRIIGDPAPNCAKNYTAYYTCSDGIVREASLPAEATGSVLHLSCLGITVLDATYGLNCGVAGGNETDTLAAACDGLGACDYFVDYLFIGDPAPNCAKTYTASYRCGDGIMRNVSLPAEATGKVAHLSCYGVAVSDATYGGNCGAPNGNETNTLADTCDGFESCWYQVDSRVIGNPAPNCAKTYTASYRCGDGSVNSVNLPAEANGDTTVLYCGPGYSYVGCFTDQPNRDLSGPSERLDTAGDVLERCVDFCRGQGQFFAGLQYGDQCFCGNTFDHYGPATNCNMPCTYDPGETCGGTWANSVYRVQ